MNDVTAMPQTAVVLGGGSDLSRAILRSLAGRRLISVLLAGRNGDSLEVAAEELRGLSIPKVETEQLDVTDIGALEGFADSAATRLGHVDLVLIAAGELDMTDIATLDAARVASLTTTNFTGPAAAMTAFARVLRAQGDGRIVVLSSVAGYRVRLGKFRLRGRQGGPRRLCSRPRRRALRKWGERDGGTARFCENEDDGGTQGAAFRHRRVRGRRRSAARPGERRRGRLGPSFSSLCLRDAQARSPLALAAHARLSASTALRRTPGAATGLIARAPGHEHGLPAHGSAGATAPIYAPRRDRRRGHVLCPEGGRACR